MSYAEEFNTDVINHYAFTGESLAFESPVALLSTSVADMYYTQYQGKVKYVHL